MIENYMPLISDLFSVVFVFLAIVPPVHISSNSIMLSNEA